jgi:hypothetical protein
LGREKSDGNKERQRRFQGKGEEKEGGERGERRELNGEREN